MNFLKSINCNSTVEAVLHSLNEIKVLAEDPQIMGPNLAGTVDNTLGLVHDLQSSLKKLSLVIELYQRQTDTTIPQLKILWDSTIVDYKSAYNASITYNKEFFSNTMFSENGKRDLASHLLALINLYTKNNTETLSMIANGDPQILAYICWPRNQE